MDKVYVIITCINNCDGDDFIVENVFTNYTHAAIRMVELNFRYNTQNDENDRTGLENEYNFLIANLHEVDKSFNKEKFVKMSKKFIRLLDNFNCIDTDGNAWKLPVYRSYIEEMPLNDNTDKYKVYYNCC